MQISRRAAVGPSPRSLVLTWSLFAFHSAVQMHGGIDQTGCVCGFASPFTGIPDEKNKDGRLRIPAYRQPRAVPSVACFA